MSGYCPGCGNTLCICDDITKQYSISVQAPFPLWRVGYHPEHDEMFLMKIERDDVVTIYRKGGMDSHGFLEYMDFSKAEILGEL